MNESNNHAGNAPASPAAVATLLREVARGLTPEAQHTLRAVARTPEAMAILAREDEALQSRRRELLAELQAQPQKRHDDRLKAAAAFDAASKKLQKLRDEVSAAGAAALAAQGRVVSLTCQDQFEAGRLERELEATADPRCDVALGLLRDLQAAARGAFYAETTYEGRSLEGNKIRGMVSNIGAVDGAVAALSLTMDAVQAIKRQALLHTEVTTALQVAFAELGPALTPLALNKLRLNEAGEPVLTGTRTAAELNASAASAGRNLCQPGQLR
jgi:hypothetical protein